MKPKLHKMLSGYILSLNGDIDDPYGIVNKELADDYGWYKLSIKNCEAIERGYDLDELKQEYISLNLKNVHDAEHYRCFAEYDADNYIKGFQKALEILGDKKFSEDDVRKAYFHGEKDSYVKGGQTKEMEDEYIRSLQQTEWDVEVEMICPHPSDTYRCGLQYGCDGDGCNHPKQVPYLDADDCLILKKI